MRKIIFLIILAYSPLFNVCLSQAIPGFFESLSMNYEYLSEFDSTLLNKPLILIEKSEMRVTHQSGGSQETARYYEYSILFSGTNKLLKFKNRSLVRKYMSVYPESKKAYNKFLGKIWGKGLGYSLSLSALGGAYIADYQGYDGLMKGLLIASVSALVTTFIVVLVDSENRNKLLDAYNKAGSLEVPKLH